MWWGTAGAVVIAGGTLLYFLLKGPKGAQANPQTPRQARAALTAVRQYGHKADRNELENLFRSIQKRFPEMKPEVKKLKRQLGMVV